MSAKKIHAFGFWYVNYMGYEIRYFDEVEELHIDRDTETIFRADLVASIYKIEHILKRVAEYLRKRELLLQAHKDALEKLDVDLSKQLLNL